MVSNQPKVVVVGAGMAGLAAAWDLSRRGLDVVVLERDAVPGGRARCRTVDGFTLEPISPVLSTADRELLAWIADVGVGDELLPLRPVVTTQVHRGRVMALDPRGLLDFARIPGVKTRHALRLARLPRLLRRYAPCIDPEAPERSADLDDRSLADFGRLYFGSSVLDRWMAPLVTASSLGDERQASRVHFLRRICREAGARAALPRGPLAELLEAAAGRLPVLLGARVTAVEPGDAGGVSVRYEREGRERTLGARAVLLATQAPEAARLGGGLLSTGERETLAAVAYTPAVTLAVATCRPLSWHPQEIRVPHAEGSPLESALLEPGVSGGRVPDGYGGATLRATGAWSAAAFPLSDEVVEKELLDAFERFQPGARGIVRFTRVFRVERALPRFDVGCYRAIARLERVEAGRRRDGRRLYLAGDYRMDPSWWGAFASGRRAARSITSDLSSPGVGFSRGERG
jgi:oxygen-dependent protoporphyrinogen oxidase